MYLRAASSTPSSSMAAGPRRGPGVGACRAYVTRLRGDEVGAQRGEARVGIVPAPDQRVRIDGRRRVHRYAPQIPVRWPDDATLRTDEGGQLRGVGDRFQQRLGSEVRPDRVDGEAERGSEFVVEGGPFGAGHDAGHPDPVAGELAGRHPLGRGELVARPGDELDGLVEDAGRLDV